MPENNGEMDQLFPSGHSHGSPRQLRVRKSTADWVVPLCPGTHTPPALRKCQKEMAFEPEWEIQESKHSKDICVQEPNMQTEPENGTVVKYLRCLSETSSADITATSGKTVDCIVI